MSGRGKGSGKPGQPGGSSIPPQLSSASPTVLTRVIGNIAQQVQGARGSGATVALVNPNGSEQPITLPPRTMGQKAVNAAHAARVTASLPGASVSYPIAAAAPTWTSFSGMPYTGLSTAAPLRMPNAEMSAAAAAPIGLSSGAPGGGFLGMPASAAPTGLSSSAPLRMPNAEMSAAAAAATPTVRSRGSTTASTRRRVVVDEGDDIPDPAIAAVTAAAENDMSAVRELPLTGVPAIKRAAILAPSAINSAENAEQTLLLARGSAAAAAGGGSAAAAGGGSAAAGGGSAAAGGGSAAAGGASASAITRQNIVLSLLPQEADAARAPPTNQAPIPDWMKTIAATVIAASAAHFGGASPQTLLACLYYSHPIGMAANAAYSNIVPLLKSVYDNYMAEKQRTAKQNESLFSHYQTAFGKPDFDPTLLMRYTYTHPGTTRTLSGGSGTPGYDAAQYSYMVNNNTFAAMKELFHIYLMLANTYRPSSTSSPVSMDMAKIMALEVTFIIKYFKHLYWANKKFAARLKLTMDSITDPAISAILADNNTLTSAAGNSANTNASRMSAGPLIFLRSQEDDDERIMNNVAATILRSGLMFTVTNAAGSLEIIETIRTIIQIQDTGVPIILDEHTATADTLYTILVTFENSGRSRYPAPTGRPPVDYGKALTLLTSASASFAFKRHLNQVAEAEQRIAAEAAAALERRAVQAVPGANAGGKSLKLAGFNAASTIGRGIGATAGGVVVGIGATLSAPVVATKYIYNSIKQAYFNFKRGIVAGFSGTGAPSYIASANRTARSILSVTGRVFIPVGELLLLLVVLIELRLISIDQIRRQYGQTIVDGVTVFLDEASRSTLSVEMQTIARARGAGGAAERHPQEIEAANILLQLGRAAAAIDAGNVQVQVDEGASASSSSSGGGGGGPFSGAGGGPSASGGSSSQGGGARRTRRHIRHIKKIRKTHRHRSTYKHRKAHGRRARTTRRR